MCDGLLECQTVLHEGSLDLCYEKEEFLCYEMENKRRRRRDGSEFWCPITWCATCSECSREKDLGECEQEYTEVKRVS